MNQWNTCHKAEDTWPLNSVWDKPWHKDPGSLNNQYFMYKYQGSYYTIIMMDHLYEPSSCLHPKWWFSTKGIPPQNPPKNCPDFGSRNIRNLLTTHQDFAPCVGGDVFLFFRQSNVPPLRSAVGFSRRGWRARHLGVPHALQGWHGWHGWPVVVGWCVVVVGWLGRTNSQQKWWWCFLDLFRSGLFIFWSFFCYRFWGRVEKMQKNR